MEQDWSSVIPSVFTFSKVPGHSPQEAIGFVFKVMVFVRT